MLNDQLYKFYNLDFRILMTSHENDLYAGIDIWEKNSNQRMVCKDFDLYYFMFLQHTIFMFPYSGALSGGSRILVSGELQVADAFFFGRFESLKTRLLWFSWRVFLQNCLSFGKYFIIYLAFGANLAFLLGIWIYQNLCWHLALAEINQ